MTEGRMSEDEPLIDKTGAARLLGVSVRTVEAWVGQRRIPFVKLGDGPRGAIRFRPSALQSWIETQEVQPVQKTGRPLTTAIDYRGTVDSDQPGRYTVRFYEDATLPPISVIIARARPQADAPVTITEIRQDGAELSEGKRQEWADRATEAVKAFRAQHIEEDGGKP